MYARIVTAACILNTQSGLASGVSLAPVRLPTDKLALLLGGLCAEGSARLPVEERDGWLFFRWEGLAGGQGQVGIRADDVECRAAMERASTEPRAFVELWALLVRLLELDGRVGEWRLERVAELLYGPRCESSHRERQLPGLRGWVALLERGWWQLDASVEPKQTGRGRKGRPGVSYGGTFAGGHLIEVERSSRCRATVRLAPALAGLRTKAYVEVPASIFRLPQDDHHNPDGNRPSLAVRARTRIGAALAGRWRQRTGQPVALEEVLVRFAGVDVGRVARRRRQASWFDALTAELVAVWRGGGVGLVERPAPRRPVLRSLVRLVVPVPPAGRGPVQARAPA